MSCDDASGSERPRLSGLAAGPGAQPAAGPPKSSALRDAHARPLAPRTPRSPTTPGPPAAPTARTSRGAGAAGQPLHRGPHRESPSSWRRSTRQRPRGLGGAAEDGLRDRGRGSRHPTALTGNPPRARNVSARPPPFPPHPSRAARRATASSASTRRLATARGGATGRLRPSETSASGTAAITLPGSAGPPGCTQARTPAPSVSESLLLSPRCSPSALPRRSSQAVMLEALGSLPTQMDYKGQKLAEQMFQGIILSSAIVGFVYGYVAEQFGWTVYIVMAGFAFSCLLTLPPWPIYRRHPLKWLPVQDSGTEDKKPGDRKIKRHAKNN
ncbi:signal peptidase complex subunit 1 [Elephas maximus indicus]|nr:signal peptidase complex subunit 1 [Elephas maximus indicus]